MDKKEFKADPERVEAARKILDGKSAKVYKTTRSGFTTSAVIAAKESGKRILCISPTNRIITHTIKKASVESAIQVAANCFCSKVVEVVKKDKFLRKLPIILPPCIECNRYGVCPVTEILTAYDPHVIGITYKKLETLMLSKSEIAEQVREELSKMDIVMPDEAHTIALPQVVRVKAFAEIDIPEDFTTLRKVLEKWLDFNAEKNSAIDDMKQEGDKGHLVKHLSKRVANDQPLSFEWISAAWEELFKMARRRHELGISEEDILTLRDMISLMSGSFVAITYIKENDGSEGSVYLTGNYWISHRALNEFLTKYASSATHLYVSGTLIEPSKDYYTNLSDKDVIDAFYPDLRRTNSKMSIYPDRWRVSSRNFNGWIDRISSRIIEIRNENKGREAYIVAPSAKKAEVLKKRLEETLGFEMPVDYYRSDQTMGVETKSRICIAIGLAEVPSNTYDHQARGKDGEERWINSQQLRQESVQAASWQTWSRVKDPEGKEERKVYCIGVRADQIRDVVAWGAGRRMELIEPQGI